MKEPQTMRDLAPPPPDVLPKGYMGREPDSDESSVAGYQHSFIDDEGFENGNVSTLKTI